MVNLTSFLMIYTFIKLSLIIKELVANEISTLKSLGVSLIGNTTKRSLGTPSPKRTVSLYI